MIKPLKNTPDTLIAFVASNEVTKEDFEKVISPAVNDLVKRTNKLNYLIVVDTPLKNFATGEWMREAMIKLNKLNKWNRSAIVSDSIGIRFFTELFGKVVPGEFRGFSHSELNQAINWASEKNGFTYQ